MENNLVSFTPANIVANGKNASEKRVSIASNAGTVSTMYIAAGKGKAAVTARAGLAEQSLVKMAHGVADGNYRPLAEALAFELGESVAILKLADLDSLVWSIEHRIANLKDEGYSVKTGKKTSTLTALEKAQNLASGVQHGAATIVAARVEARRISKMEVKA